MNKGRRVILAALMVWTTVSCLAGAAETTTVFLVRHAEKAQGSDDPALTEAGQARAAELARLLADVKVTAVYSTPFARTRQTAEPLAKAKGLEISTTPIDKGMDAHVADIHRRVLAEHVGSTVLVVGHSNTVPAILEGMGVDKAPALTEKDYDDLFLLTLDESGEARLVHLHYGIVSP